MFGAEKVKLIYNQLWMGFRVCHMPYAKRKCIIVYMPVVWFLFIQIHRNEMIAKSSHTDKIMIFLFYVCIGYGMELQFYLKYTEFARGTHARRFHWNAYNRGVHLVFIWKTHTHIQTYIIDSRKHAERTIKCCMKVKK